MDRVTVFDTTLRDGEQSPGSTMTPGEKLRMARQLDALGVDVIEAGFPVSSPDDFRAVRTIAREVRRPVIAGLARAKPGDIDRAAEAVEEAERARIHVFIATSELHLERKLGICREACVERAARSVERARRRVDDVEFSPEDATRSDPAFLCEVVEAAIAAGATTVNIPDTVGYACPPEIRELIELLFERVPGIEDVTVSVHCHDDLGLAVANSIAAVEAGARQVECTVNGIGERAGNASLEELVMALAVRGDVLPYETAIRTEEIHRTSRLLSRFTGIHPQPNKAVVGRNAFAHEAGIHQHGMIRDRQTYEIMTPEMVGAPGTRFVLGKHSGRHALLRRYRELGYELDAGEVDEAYDRFRGLADRKKTVLDEDLLAILHDEIMDDVPEFFSLRALEVTAGRGGDARARVEIAVDGIGVESADGRGDGPIAAAFTAVNEVVERRVELEDLTIRAATPGRDAVGEVSLRARVEGRTFGGRGSSTDVVEAAVKAYLHAMCKSERARKLEARVLHEANQLWGV